MPIQGDKLDSESILMKTSTISVQPEAVIDEEIVAHPFNEMLFTDDAVSEERTYLEYSNGESFSKKMNLGQIVVFPPPLKRPREIFIALQKWEGYVTEVKEDVFCARLIPIVGEGTEQIAEIYIEEVDNPDREMIEPGAVFYWTIGYNDKPSGRQRASIIRFRRLPIWTQSDINAASDRCANLREVLGAE